jgi:hypothetical protein
MADVIGVGGVLVFGVHSLGHFTEKFCEFVFVLAHVVQCVVGQAPTLQKALHPYSNRL